MLLEAKISNPVRIRLGKNSNFIMADEKNKENHPLIPGALFGGEHYGFILIVDYNGKQKEFVYPTQCKIEGAGILNNILNIFEEGKKIAWKFDKSGNLEHSAFDEFTDEFRSKFDVVGENYDMFMGKPILINPINIKIALDPEESVILKDDDVQENYPLFPGVMLGTEHYGFVLLIDSANGQKEIIYPTQNRIEAVGIEKSTYHSELKIFEKSKYHPWVFTPDGKFKSESSYNQYSRRDKLFVKECYGLNENSSECFHLQKKK